jgi:hypothetical protein
LDPCPYLRDLCFLDNVFKRIDNELTDIQWCVEVPFAQQIGHKGVQIVELLLRDPFPTGSRGDAHYRYGPPEVAPATREHTGLHGLPRRQKREHVLQRLIRKYVYPTVVAAAHITRLLELAPAVDLYFFLRHCVELVASTGAGKK